MKKKTKIITIRLKTNWLIATAVRIAFKTFKNISKSFLTMKQQVNINQKKQFILDQKKK